MKLRKDRAPRVWRINVLIDNTCHASLWPEGFTTGTSEKQSHDEINVTCLSIMEKVAKEFVDGASAADLEELKASLITKSGLKYIAEDVQKKPAAASNK